MTFPYNLKYFCSRLGVAPNERTLDKEEEVMANAGAEEEDDDDTETPENQTADMTSTAPQLPATAETSATEEALLAAAEAMEAAKKVSEP